MDEYTWNTKVIWSCGLLAKRKYFVKPTVIQLAYQAIFDVHPTEKRDNKKNHDVKL